MSQFYPSKPFIETSEKEDSVFTEEKLNKLMAKYSNKLSEDVLDKLTKMLKEKLGEIKSVEVNKGRKFSLDL